MDEFDKLSHQRDLVAYEALGVLRCLHAGGDLPKYTSAGDIIARYDALTAALNERKAAA
jgi:hypothetical protein